MTVSTTFRASESAQTKLSILVLAPFGQDAALMVQMLRDADIQAACVSEMAAFADRLPEYAVGLLTTEALSPDALAHLQATLQSQPSWSDIPLVLLSGRIDPASYRILTNALGNVTIIPRPLEAASLLTVVQMALRARQKQYEVRSLLAAGETHKGRIQALNDHLLLAIGTAQMGTWQLDLRTETLICSDGCKANFGLPSEAPFDYHARTTMIVPEDRARLQSAVKQAIAQHSVYEMEYRIHWPDGSVQWIVDSGRALYDENDIPTQMAGVTLKVTERKQSEKILRASEEKSRNILESISDAFFALDREWRFTYVNHQAGIVLNRQPHDLLGQSLWEEYPGTVGSEFEKAYRLAADEGIASDFTAFYPDHDRFYEVHAYPATDGITVYFRDATERKRTEEALQESEERFRGLADNITQLAWIADDAGSIFWYNRRWFEYTGTTLEEMQGWGWKAVHAPEHIERVVEKFTRAVARQEVWEDTFPLRGKDGKYRWFLSRAVPVQDHAKNVTRWFGTNTDVTEQREAEEKLRERQTEIETLNHRLKRAMTETHHRVKNNLQMISAMIEMQIFQHRTEETVPIEEYVQLKAHVHMLALVHDLLTKSVKEEEETQRISAKAVLDKLLPMLHRTAWNQHVQYSVEEVELSSKQCISLSLILNELVTNALKHGRNTAEVVFRIQEEKAILEVLDDGPGFKVGFSPLEASNMGLELVESLIRTDLKGNSRYETRAEGGGRVLVSFPLPPSDP